MMLVSISIPMYFLRLIPIPIIKLISTIILILFIQLNTLNQVLSPFSKLSSQICPLMLYTSEMWNVVPIRLLILIIIFLNNLHIIVDNLWTFIDPQTMLQTLHLQLEFLDPSLIDSLCLTFLTFTSLPRCFPI